MLKENKTQYIMWIVCQQMLHMIYQALFGFLMKQTNFKKLSAANCCGTVKPVLSGHSKRRLKLVFKIDYPLMQVKSIAECSKGSILQYFRPSLSYTICHYDLCFVYFWVAA